MCKHETKTCRRCQQLFECKKGTVAQCQCMLVTLSMEQQMIIAQRYSDCLCKECLVALSGEWGSAPIES